MLINVRKLIGLPVFTQSGEKLGEVSDVNLDIESHVVREYLIKKNFFNKSSHIIKPNQVRQVTAEKMIVDDCFIKEAEEKRDKEKALSSTPAFGGVMASEE